MIVFRTDIGAVGVPLNKQIVNLLCTRETGLTVAEIADVTGANTYAIGLILGNLARSGHAQKRPDGRWELARLKDSQ